MSRPMDFCCIRFDIDRAIPAREVVDCLHRVLSEVGFIYEPIREVRDSTDREVSRQEAEDRYHANIERVNECRRRLATSMRPSPQIASQDTGWKMDMVMLEEVENLESMLLPRLPHRLFGMTNTMSQSAPDLPAEEAAWSSGLRLMYVLNLAPFGMSDIICPNDQAWRIFHGSNQAEESLEPETANHLWLFTEVYFRGWARGFERYLQLATQEVAIRAHRELRSRETVGLIWRDHYDPQFPEACWMAERLFQFTESGDEFMWDYLPGTLPERVPLFVPHADAPLEREVTQYEKWLIDTYTTKT
jgi:hypothetical protein